MMRDIITYPDKRLRDPCKLVTENDDLEEVSKILEEMQLVLNNKKTGFALAANQVGFFYRLLVFNAYPGHVINPEIITRSQEKSLMQESCLSLPGFSKLTERHEKVLVSFITLHRDSNKKLFMKKNEEEYSGIMAQAWQHEIEHLDGKLFIDDLSKSIRTRLAHQIIKK